MRKLKSLTVLVSVAALGIGLSGLTTAANAEGSGVKVNAYQQLRFDQGAACSGIPTDTSTIGWQTVAEDSPLDTNSQALVTTVDSALACTDAFTRSSLHINKLVGNVKNLSYDFQSNETTGGAPRISIIFTNGDVAFPAANRCANPIAVSGGTWSRADFTGGTITNSGGPCILDVSGVSGGTYTSTATQSAWAVYAAAWPTQVVSYDFLQFDGAAATYTVDRVSLGTGWMFNANNTHAVKCTSEAAC